MQKGSPTFKLADYYTKLIDLSPKSAYFTSNCCKVYNSCTGFQSLMKALYLRFLFLDSEPVWEMFQTYHRAKSWASLHWTSKGIGVRYQFLFSFIFFFWGGGRGEADVSCPNIFSSACSKIKGGLPKYDLPFCPKMAFWKIWEEGVQLPSSQLRTPMVKRNITYSERYSLKYTASKWIIFRYNRKLYNSVSSTSKTKGWLYKKL